MTRAYNSWVADLTSQSPDRLKWVTVPAPCPSAGIGSGNRARQGAGPGSRDASRLLSGDVRIDDPPMEPIWAAANDTGLPVRGAYRTHQRCPRPG